MDFELVLITSILSTFLPALFALTALNKALSDDLKIQFAQYLESYAARDFARFTSRVFGSVFGDRVFSMRSFVCSCAASLLTASIAFLVVFGSSGVDLSDSNLFRLVVVIVILNFVPDYFSLCLTRCIVDQMTKSNSAVYQLLMTILDFTLSLCIILMYLALYFALFHLHIPVVMTPLGADIVLVVVLSTMIFSILNLAFSTAVFLITITPKNIVFSFIERPLTLVAAYVTISLFFLAIPLALLVVAFSYFELDNRLYALFLELPSGSETALPNTTELFSVLLAFLVLISLSGLALSQSAQSYRAYAIRSKWYRIHIAFTVVIFLVIGAKLISPTFIGDTNTSLFLKNIINVYVVPTGIPKWQLASLINGILALSLTWLVQTRAFRAPPAQRWAAEFRNWFVRLVRIFSAMLSCYTICVLIYNTATIQWDLLPICEEWTPWQKPQGTCAPIAEASTLSVDYS